MNPDEEKKKKDVLLKDEEEEKEEEVQHYEELILEVRNIFQRLRYLFSRLAVFIVRKIIETV